jgi:hypothetical protein
VLILDCIPFPLCITEYTADNKTLFPVIYLFLLVATKSSPLRTDLDTTLGNPKQPRVKHEEHEQVPALEHSRVCLSLLKQNGDSFEP